MSKKTISSELQAIISAADTGLNATVCLLATQFLKNEPENLRVLIDLGHASWQLARYDQAEMTLQRALEISEPEKRDVVYGELGNLHRAKGQFSRAAEFYQQQIETDPKDATGYLFLGSLQMKLGDFNSAASTLQSGQSCEYGCLEEVDFTLGIVLLAQSRFDEAILQFQKSLERDATYGAAKIALKDAKAARGL